MNGDSKICSLDDLFCVIQVLPGQLLLAFVYNLPTAVTQIF